MYEISNNDMELLKRLLQAFCATDGDSTKAANQRRMARKLQRKTATPPILTTSKMSDFKSIKEIIDTYYPEIAERLRHGERNGK